MKAGYRLCRLCKEGGSLPPFDHHHSIGAAMSETASLDRCTSDERFFGAFASGGGSVGQYVYEEIGRDRQERHGK